MKIFPNKQKFKGKKQDSVIGLKGGSGAGQSAHPRDSRECAPLCAGGERPREEPLCTYTNVEGTDLDYKCWQAKCPATLSRDSNKI